MSIRYDDGGWSGGTLNRPALARLRSDIIAGEVDIVVVYKIDRLSRSLRDFTNLIAEFEVHKVTFVAVTQSFDTGTAMGRLTLNVLLSFAQFERELTGERLRDWFAGARARGLWKHGLRPYGYQVVDGKLVVDPVEANVVRYMYRTYLRIGSARLLAEELTARGHLNKFGRPFNKRTVTNTLQNQIYCGYLTHRGKRMPAMTHEPIISERTYKRVQEEMAKSGRRRAALRRPPVRGMLKGIIFDATGRAMIHTFLKRGDRIYRYYVRTVRDSHGWQRYGSLTTPSFRFRAAELEAEVLALIDRLSGGTPARRSTEEAEGHVRRMVDRVIVYEDKMLVRLSTGAEISCGLAGRVAPTRRTQRRAMR